MIKKLIFQELTLFSLFSLLTLTKIIKLFLLVSSCILLIGISPASAGETQITIGGSIRARGEFRDNINATLDTRSRRIINVPPDVDPRQYIKDSDLQNNKPHVVSDREGGYAIIVTMSDEEWQRRHQQLCGVEGCEDDHCQEFLLPEKWDGGLLADVTPWQVEIESRIIETTKGRVRTGTGKPVSDASGVVFEREPSVESLMSDSPPSNLPGFKDSLNRFNIDPEGNFTFPYRPGDYYIVIGVGWESQVIEIQDSPGTVIAGPPTPEGTKTRSGTGAPPVKTGTRSSEEEDNGDDPRDTPPPVIYGEEIDDSCTVSIDIHKPKAQDNSEPKIMEEQDSTVGAYTLRNNDIDDLITSLNDDRLEDGSDLLKVKGKSDIDINGAIEKEDDLVKIDLCKDPYLDNVYFNAYAMAYEINNNVPAQKGFRPFEPAAKEPVKLRLYRNVNRSGAVKLPYKVNKFCESLYVEGLKGGRYRLVIFHLKDGSPKDVFAREIGDPHKTPAAKDIDLKFKKKIDVPCRDNVRLTVAIVDIKQTTKKQKSSREHVYDIFWKGRPLFAADLWPPKGSYRWGQSARLPGSWLKGKLRGKPVKPEGSAKGGPAEIVRIHGGFEHKPKVKVGKEVKGSGPYEHRMHLDYNVESNNLQRKEPVTLMVPHNVKVTPLKRRNGKSWSFNQKQWGSTYKVDLKVRYQLFEQLKREMVGPKNVTDYENRYGQRLRMYEALGMGVNAHGKDDIVRMVYQSTLNNARNFTLPIGTKQRRFAIPKKGKTLSDGNFLDHFRMKIEKKERGHFMADLREDEKKFSGKIIFSVSQDIVALLENDKGSYDVRVAKDQRLEIYGPQERKKTKKKKWVQNPTTKKYGWEEVDEYVGEWGGIGFRMVLGSGGGSVIKTGGMDGLPDYISKDHNPPAPPK